MAYNYPYGNGQQLNLDWFLNEWKNLLAAWEAEKNGIEGALQAEIDRAEAALADVFAARDAAAQSAANALESKNAAAQSASDASGYLATVRADANTASNAAQNAAQSESNAADYAQTALASKSAAAQSETAAGNSASAAAQSETAAGNSASAAAQSETAAGNSASAAAQSADAAEDAASSVEASAQQIATNTSNIAKLKNSTSIINNVNESLVHFADGNNSPLENLVLDSGATKLYVIGKNFANVVEDNITGSQQNNHTIANNGIILESTGNYPRLALLIPVKTGHSYTINLKAKKTGTIQRVAAASALAWDYDYGVIASKVDMTTELQQFSLTFTAITDTLYIEIYGGNNSTLTVEDIQVEYGNTATVFETYRGEIYTIESGTPTEEPNSLNGVNNIFADSGNVAFQYIANTKLYIDNKIAELQATMLENIGG